MIKHSRIVPVVLGAGLVAGIALTLSDASARGKQIELDEAAVFIEWNSTDTDFGIQVFWDGEPWKKMTVKNERGKPVMGVKVKKNLKAQGMTEGFFESAEPPASELDMDQFFARHPEVVIIAGLAMLSGTSSWFFLKLTM